MHVLGEMLVVLDIPKSLRWPLPSILICDVFELLRLPLLAQHLGELTEKNHSG